MITNMVEVGTRPVGDILGYYLKGRFDMCILIRMVCYCLLSVSVLSELFIMGCGGLGWPSGKEIGTYLENRIIVPESELETVANADTKDKSDSISSQIVGLLPSNDGKLLYVFRHKKTEDANRSSQYRISAELNALNTDNFQWVWADWLNVGGSCFDAVLATDGKRMAIMSEADPNWPSLSGNYYWLTLVDLSNPPQEVFLLADPLLAKDFLPIETTNLFHIPLRLTLLDDRQVIFQIWQPGFGGGGTYLFSSPLLDFSKGRVVPKARQIGLWKGAGPYFVVVKEAGIANRLHIIYNHMNDALNHDILEEDTSWSVKRAGVLAELNSVIDAKIVNGKLFLTGRYYLADLSLREDSSAGTIRRLSIWDFFIAVNEKYLAATCNMPAGVPGQKKAGVEVTFWDLQNMDDQVCAMIEGMDSIAAGCARWPPRIADTWGVSCEKHRLRANVLIGHHLYGASSDGTKIVRYDLLLAVAKKPAEGRESASGWKIGEVHPVKASN